MSNDTKPSPEITRRTAVDGASRRRLYLFRHGAVDYMDDHGNWVEDPDIVDLNARGRAQAESMAALFAGIHVDKAICSGLPRTLQTGKAILADRALEIEVVPELEEIRGLMEEPAGGYDICADVAFSHWRAEREDARFLGGERYHDFYSRITGAMETVLVDPSWHNLAVFAHGGTNAAILGWATGVGLQAFGLLDQSMCCLNIVDFDVDDSGVVLRKTVRGMNITADDPVMRERHASDMEMLARRILKWQQ